MSLFDLAAGLVLVVSALIGWAPGVDRSQAGSLKVEVGRSP